MRKLIFGKRMLCVLDVFGRRVRVRCFYFMVVVLFWFMRVNWGYWECGVVIF